MQRPIPTFQLLNIIIKLHNYQATTNITNIIKKQVNITGNQVNSDTIRSHIPQSMRFRSITIRHARTHSFQLTLPYITHLHTRYYITIFNCILFASFVQNNERLDFYMYSYVLRSIEGESSGFIE